MTERTFLSTQVQVKRLRVSNDQGEFLPMKTLSGRSAPRCDKDHAENDGEYLKRFGDNVV